MSTKTKIPAILLVVLAVMLIGFSLLWKEKAPDNKIRATVNEIVKRPNRAEDGVYKIMVKDDSDTVYTIRADQYLNTPKRPEDNNQVCLPVPELTEGDELTFNLPGSDHADGVFLTCFDENITGYFIETR